MNKVRKIQYVPQSDRVIFIHADNRKVEFDFSNAPFPARFIKSNRLENLTYTHQTTLCCGNVFIHTETYR